MRGLGAGAPEVSDGGEWQGAVREGLGTEGQLE